MIIKINTRTMGQKQGRTEKKLALNIYIKKSKTKKNQCIEYPTQKIRGKHKIK